MTGDPLADLDFMRIVLEESKRDLLVNPADEERIRAALLERGMDGRFTVRAVDVVPEGQCIVVDVGALEAAAKEAVQSAHGWFEQRWAELEAEQAQRRRCNQIMDQAAEIAINRPRPPFAGGVS